MSAQHILIFVVYKFKLNINLIKIDKSRLTSYASEFFVYTIEALRSQRYSKMCFPAFIRTFRAVEDLFCASLSVVRESPGRILRRIARIIWTIKVIVLNSPKEWNSSSWWNESPQLSVNVIEFWISGVIISEFQARSSTASFQSLIHAIMFIKLNKQSRWNPFKCNLCTKKENEIKKFQPLNKCIRKYMIPLEFICHLISLRTSPICISSATFFSHSVKFFSFWLRRWFDQKKKQKW